MSRRGQKRRDRGARRGGRRGSSWEGNSSMRGSMLATLRVRNGFRQGGCMSFFGFPPQQHGLVANELSRLLSDGLAKRTKRKEGKTIVEFIVVA